LDPTDAIILVVCGISGFLIGKKLSIPAYALIGPMVFSAAVHLAGFTTGNVPRELASVAQLVVGTAVGCRFVGITLGTMFRVSWLAAVNATLLILAAALTVSLVTRYFDTPPPILFLSLAPGGLAEMSLIALALGVDTAFVTVMHFMRLLLVMMLAPAAYRILGGRPPADTE
jgi:membrane AbrB-like protein